MQRIESILISIRAYIEILRMLQMMRPKQSIGSSPNRIRSFLTPSNKLGARSLSTTDTKLKTPPSNQPHKTYIDFRRINRQKQIRSNLRIKPEEFSTKQYKKDQKLYKCTMNKYKENNLRQQKYEDNGDDLLKMVRELKQRVINLQVENKILKQKQEEDLKKIQKQNQIIKNLEQAIYLNRGHSFSVVANPKQSRYLCLSDFSKHSKSTNISFEQPNEVKTVKFQQQSTKPSEKYHFKLQQNRTIKLPSQFTHKTTPNPYLLYQKQRMEGLERALQQIQEKKLKELEEIDQILFGSCF